MKGERRMILSVKESLFRNRLAVVGHMVSMVDFERACKAHPLYHGMILDLCFGIRYQDMAGDFFVNRGDTAMTYADLFVKLNSLSGMQRNRFGIRKFCPCVTVELPNGQRRELITSREEPGLMGIRVEFSPWVKEMVWENRYHDIPSMKAGELACLVFEDTESLLRHMRDVKAARMMYALENPGREKAPEWPKGCKRRTHSELDALFYEL